LITYKTKAVLHLYHTILYPPTIYQFWTRVIIFRPFTDQ